MFNAELANAVKNFAAPIINISMKSQMLNVDGLLPQKTPEQEKAEVQTAVTKILDNR